MLRCLITLHETGRNQLMLRIDAAYFCWVPTPSVLLCIRHFVSVIRLSCDCSTPNAPSLPSPPSLSPSLHPSPPLAFWPFWLIFQTDLVSQDAIDDVVSKVRAINAVAEVRCTKRSTVDLAWVLDTRCFSSDLALAVEPHVAPGGVYAPETAPQQYGGGAPDNPGLGFDGAVVSRERGEVTGAAGGGHKEDGHHHATEEEYMKCAKASAEGPGGTACSVHDPLVTTYAVDLPGSLELQRLERWLGGLLWDPPAGGTEIYRVKGVVSVQERDERFVVQGVADLFEVTPAGASGSAWREGEARRCKVVFIGRLLSKDGLELGLKSCMV